MSVNESWRSGSSRAPKLEAKIRTRLELAASKTLAMAGRVSFLLWGSIVPAHQLSSGKRDPRDHRAPTGTAGQRRESRE